jgi:hypothetical protein
MRPILILVFFYLNLVFALWVHAKLSKGWNSLVQASNRLVRDLD